MKPKRLFSVAVFCSTATNLAPEFYEQTSLLGRWIGEQGMCLVYDGACFGLMEHDVVLPSLM
jgi:predicted Rossmann-fold nucleotide-binding protein